MIDIKLIRENLGWVKQNLQQRNQNFNAELENIYALDQKIRKLTTLTQSLEAQRNKLSREMGLILKNKQFETAENKKDQVAAINLSIATYKKELATIQEQFNNIMFLIPNLIDSSVPKGLSENDNKKIRSWEDKKLSNNTPHWEIAEKFRLVDFARATKISGSRFVIYQNLGAKLVRALINYMLDQSQISGYQEQLPPLIVNEQTLIGTGQLPKFINEQFKIDSRKQFLIPTGEVPLASIFRDEIINSTLLPIKLSAYTPCFRQEAGAAGRDTRGLIRLHQFNKVELVEIVKPENSDLALEKMVNYVESLLISLNIPFETTLLCSGDIGFQATKTYDINVWMPAQNVYREISSCSNCSDFQARRMGLRVVTENGQKFIPHTLNGSGLAVDRIFAAILENYYDSKNAIIHIPVVLQPYMNNMKTIEV